MPYISRWKLKKARKRFRRYRRGYSTLRALRERAQTEKIEFGPTGARGSKESIAMYGPSWAAADVNQRAARKNMGFYGRGAYYGDGAYFRPNETVAAGLRSGGEWLGNLTGIEGMGGVGRWAAGKASKWLGFGAYGLAANQNMMMPGRQDGSSGAMVSHSVDERGDLIISNTEFVENVVSGTGTPSTFTSKQIFFNPADDTVFPWLAHIAKMYEEYKWLQLVFHYKPLATDYTTASSLGQVIIGPNYNISQNKYRSSAQMLNSDDCVTGTPNQPILCGIECDPATQSRIVYETRNSGAVNSETDFFALNYATEGVPQPNALLGQLWITYTCKLSKKTLDNLPQETMISFIGQNTSTFLSAAPTRNYNYLKGIYLSAQANSQIPQEITTTTANPDIFIHIPAHTGKTFDIHVGFIKSTAGTTGAVTHTMNYIAATNPGPSLNCTILLTTPELVSDAFGVTTSSGANTLQFRVTVTDVTAPARVQCRTTAAAGTLLSTTEMFFCKVQKIPSITDRNEV